MIEDIIAITALAAFSAIMFAWLIGLVLGVL